MPEKSKPITHESFGSFIDDSGTRMFDIDWDAECFKLTGNEGAPLCFSHGDAAKLRDAVQQFLNGTEYAQGKG